MPTESPTTRLIYWILGILTTGVLGAVGLVASHQLSQIESINSRLGSLEVNSGRSEQHFSDIERRLQRIENRLEEGFRAAPTAPTR